MPVTVTEHEYDVVVLGLGAMGSAAAYHLSRRGQRVLGLDAYPAGHTMGSSHGESRIIRRAYYEHPGYNPLLARAYELWEELARESGDELLYNSGGLMIGLPEHELVAGSIAACQEKGRTPDVLDAGQVRDRFPAFILDDDEVGFFDPLAGILFADRCNAAHQRLAVAQGAELRHETPVRAWTATDNGVQIETDHGTIQARRLVITAGPWVTRMLPELNLPIQIERIPVFYWQPKQPELFELGRFPIYMWERGDEGVFYGFPHLTMDGVKAGRHHNRDHCDPATVERVVTAADERLCRDFMSRHIPSLNGELVQHYTCLYTTTVDEHFLIDYHPAHPNVVYASSCSGHGYKFSAVVGELLTDLSLTSQMHPAADFLKGSRLGVTASAR